MRTVIESANADHTCARDPAIRLRNPAQQDFYPGNYLGFYGLR